MSLLETLAAKLGTTKSQGQPIQNGKQNNQQPQSQNTGQQPNNQQPNGQAPAQPDNGMQPNGNAQSFEDMYKDIWKDKPVDPNAGNGKLFNPDMAAFGKAVEGMDFAGNVDPELQTKALAGDAAALKQLLNQTGRASFSRSALMASEMMNDGFAKKSKEFDQTMDEKFRAHTTRQNLLKNNEAFASPEIRPLVESIESRLRARFPEASAEDITQKAQEYLVGMAGKIHGGAQPKTPANGGKGGESAGAFAGEDGNFDWLKYAGNGDEPNLGQNLSPLS